MSRTLTLSLLLYSLVFAALATLRGELLALALPLLVYAGAGLVFGPAVVRLRLIRRLDSDRVGPHEPVAVEVSLTNEGQDLEEVHLEDRLPDRLRVASGEAAYHGPLPAGATVRLTYAVVGPRGHYRFGRLTVAAADHLGVWTRRLDLEAPSRLFVVPRVPRLRRLVLRPLRTLTLAGPIPSRVGGQGVAFYGLRELQPGDPLRHVHWKALARHPEKIYAKEFEQERTTEVGLILDARIRSEIVLPHGSLFDRSVEATAALADALLGLGNRVGLLVYGRVLDWTFPGYGKVQRERLLRALARAEPGESLVFHTLEYLPLRLFPPGSQVVWISPLHRDDVEQILRLRARNYQVLVISPDPVSFEASALPDIPPVRLARRLAHLERRWVFHRLREGGVIVVDWPADAPLERALGAALRRPPPWRPPRGGLR